MGPWTPLSETAYTSILIYIYIYIYIGKSLYILNGHSKFHHYRIIFCYEILNFRNFANFLPGLTITTLLQFSCMLYFICFKILNI